MSDGKSDVGTLGQPKPLEEAELCQVCEANDDSDEEFWHGLTEVKPPAPRFDSHDRKPHECYRGVVRLSRMQRLTASRSDMNDEVAILGLG